jgi:hypothetical protein
MGIGFALPRFIEPAPKRCKRLDLGDLVNHPDLLGCDGMRLIPR